MLFDSKPLEKPKQLLELGEKSTFIRLYAFEKILKSLSKAKEEDTLGFGLQAGYLLECINKWLDIGKKEYKKLEKKNV